MKRRMPCRAPPDHAKVCTTAGAWLPAAPHLQALGIRGRRVARRSEHRALRAAARAIRLHGRQLALQRGDAGASLLRSLVRGRGSAHPLGSRAVRAPAHPGNAP